MKKVSSQIIFVLIFLSIITAGCSSGSRLGGGSSKNCGCGANKGFVGY